MIDPKDTSPKTSARAIRNRRVCYHCAHPIMDTATLICPNCKSEDIDERRARPRKTEPRCIAPLPHPWDKLQMREGGTVLLSGNKGSGKTTIAMTVAPTLYISTEQELEEVAHTWYRVMGNSGIPVPLMTNCYTWEELHDDLLMLKRGDRVIVDSISQFSYGPDSTEICKLVIERVRKTGALAWFIVQFTKQGDMLGPNMLNHMVDVVCTIPDDTTGLRRLTSSKNRFGDLFAKYFSLSGEGVIDQPFNEYAYTVEGSAGNYSLHLYPMGGAKYSGIFDALTEVGIQIEGMASAAIKCNGYKNGFAEPNEIKMRQKFAEEHGLIWVSPESARELIQEALEGQGKTQEI